MDPTVVDGLGTPSPPGARGPGEPARDLRTGRGRPGGKTRTPIETDVTRSLPTRLTALLMAALLLFAGGREAFGIGACPHHDSGASHGGAGADHGEPGGHDAFVPAAVGGAQEGASGSEGHGGRHLDDGDRVTRALVHGAEPATGHGHLTGSDLRAGDEAPAGHHGGCTCLGSCQGSAATVLPPTGGEAISAPPTPRVASTISDDDRDLPGPPPHNHPFATAPPLTR